MANYQYLDDTGVIIPDTNDILTTVQDEYKTAFGSDMNTDPSTPQGMLITAETEARKEVVDNNAALANQINPNISGGNFLDAICALTGLSRAVATRSTILGVAVTGVSFTIIPQGSQAKTTDGDLFMTTGNVQLALDGTATVDFESVDFGAIPAPASSLTTIVTNVLGWETVTNANTASLGTGIQSDLSLRKLRNNTLALQGVSIVEAITSALYATPEVKSISFLENVANTTQTIDGISLVAHSVWACVDGGTDTDVATSLLTNKSAGANWNGATTVNVLEPASGQTYAVKFDRPTLVPMLAKATVHVSPSIVNPTLAVQQAILDYANGLIQNQTGFTVGTSVSPFELAAAVNQEVSGVYVQKMEVKKVASGSFVTTEIALAINEKATILIGGITVVLV